MNNEFDTEFINISEKIKGGYAYLISNISKIVALITLIVTALLVFTDIAFLGFDSKEFSTSLILILISSYVIYFSLEEAGERLFEEGDEYKAALSEYVDVTRRIYLDMMPDLRDFCEKHADDDLLYRRRQALLSLGFTEEEYLSFKRGEPMEKKKIASLKKISRIRRAKLTPDMLLSTTHSNREQLKDPGKDKFLVLLLKILPSTICMFFTASVVLSAKEMSAVTILEGIMKLSTLPIVGFRGYVNGYNYKKIREVAWLKTKTKLLTGFLSKIGDKG